jgi:hypothetical protein
VAEQFAVERLEVDRGEVVVAADVVGPQVGHDRVAGGDIAQMVDTPLAVEFDPNDQKLEFEYKKVFTWADAGKYSDEIEDYVMRDVVLLEKTFTKFVSTLYSFD